MKAIADFNAAEKLDPNFPLVYYWRGISKVRIGELEESIQDFKK